MIKDQRLEGVEIFKYIASVIFNEEFPWMIILQRDKNITLASYIKFMRKLSLSTWIIPRVLWDLIPYSRIYKKNPITWDEMLSKE